MSTRLVLVVVSVLLQLSLGNELSYKEWRAEFGREAHLVDDVSIDRERVYYDNVERIRRLNEEDNGCEFRVNQFAAMTPEEFTSKVLMPPRRPPQFDESRYMGPADSKVDLPDTFDWRTRNMVTSVKDQGALGTCWAFSTIGNIEGQWAMHNHTLESLSVEQVVDCDGTADIQKGQADCGVFGGWPYLAYQYVERTGGLEAHVDYPYCTENCYPCVAPGYNKTLCGMDPPWCLKNESCAAKIDRSKFVKGLQVEDWKAISQNETEIAYRLMAMGPLSVALDASLLTFYHSGVWHTHFCSKTELDHAVLMVGFGTEKDLLSTKPYWLIKNSWGPKWGEKGYFKIERGLGMCGINTQVTTSILAN